MYKTILVPLDGSEFGERALPMAAALARAMNAQLVLMCAASATTFPGTDATEAQVQAVAEAQAYLQATAADLSGQGLKVDVAVPYGPAAESILLEVELRHADLLVMCTHGRSGLGRWVYGSVAEEVLARSPVPVLLVRHSGEVATLGPEPEQASLLVTLDGSAFAETALPHAVTLARTFGGSILLLRTVEESVPAHRHPSVAILQEATEEQMRASKSYLDDVAERLRQEGVAVQTMVLKGWAADVIAYRGAALGPRLIVMATHGRTGVARWFLGSVAQEVIRRSPLPVLLVRPAAPAGEDDRAA